MPNIIKPQNQRKLPPPQKLPSGATIPSKLVLKRPVIPLTVTESKLVKKYGSLERARQIQKLEAKKKKIAERIDSDLQSSVTNLSQLEKLYNQVPDELKKYIKYNPKFVKKELEKREQQILKDLDHMQNLYDTQVKKRDLAERQGRSDRADDLEPDIEYKRAYIKKLKEGIGYLRKGQIIDVKDIKRFAGRYADYREERRAGRIENRKARVKALREQKSRIINIGSPPPKKSIRKKYSSDFKSISSQVIPPSPVKPIKEESLTKTNGRRGVFNRIRNRLHLGVANKSSFLPYRIVSSVKENIQERKQKIQRKRKQPINFVKSVDVVPKESPHIKFGEAASQSFSILKAKIAGKDIKAGILDPFKITGKTKEEKFKKNISEKPFLGVDQGTMQYGKPTNLTIGEQRENISSQYLDLKKYGGYSEKAAYSKLAEDISRNVSQDLSRKYQRKINRGKLSVGEAQKQFEEEAKKQFGEKYKNQSSRLSQYYKRFGSSNVQKRAGESGVKAIKFVGESALYLTPQTAAIAEAARASKEPEVISSGKYTGKTALKQVGKSVLSEAAVLPFVGSKYRNIEKSIVKDELNQLSKQELKFVERQFVEEKGKTFVKLKGVQKYKGLKTEVNIKGEVEKIDKNSYRMIKGSGTSETTGELSWNIKGGARPSKVLSKGEFDVGGKGTSFKIKGNMVKGDLNEKTRQLIKSERLKGFLAKGVSEPKFRYGAIYQEGKLKPKTSIEFPTGRIKREPSKEFKGVLKQFGKTLKIGGEGTINIETGASLRLTPDLYYSRTPTSRGLTKIERAAEKKRPIFEVTGKPSISKVEKPSFVFSETTNPKTPFSKTFGKEEKVINKIERPKRIFQKSPIVKQEIKETGGEFSIIKSSEKSAESISKKSSRTLSPLLKEETRASVSLSLLTGSASRYKSKQKIKTKQLEKAISDQKIENKPFQSAKESQGLLPIQLNKTKLNQQQDQIGELAGGHIPIKPKIPVDLETPILVPRPPAFFFPGERPKYRKQQAYDAYAYRKATKKHKAHYEKLNKEPLTKRSAVSMMARNVDRTISARGKIVKTPDIIKKIGKGRKKKIKPLAKDTKDNYWRENKQKFRQWRTKKRVPLPTGIVIERQKYRLDNPGEVKKIHRARRAKRISAKLFNF